MKRIHMWVLVAICCLFTAFSSVSFASKEVQEKQPVTVEGIKAQLLELPWSFEDRKIETPEEREARAEVMAQALYNAAQQMPKAVYRRAIIAAAISIWWFETRFGLAVHRGERSKYGSDDGKAKCFGQHHERSVGLKKEPEESLEDFRARQRAMWESLAGVDLEATERCALATMRVFDSKFMACRKHATPIPAAFGAYGTGGECGLLPTSNQRAELMSRLAPRL